MRANTTGADHTAWVRSHVCAFVISIKQQALKHYCNIVLKFDIVSCCFEE